MSRTITYKKAVILMAAWYRGSMFDASTILSLLFSIDKENTLEDLLTERKKLRV
jgi:hypothetical protein